MLSLNRRFAKDTRGMSAIEFAILLPIASLFVMGIVEFGISGLKGQSLQRSLAAATGSVQSNPLDLTNEQLANTNTSLINFGTDGNYICAMSYETLEAANGGDCSGGWNVAAPSQDLDSYFILMKGYVTNAALTGLMDPFIGDITDRQVIRVGGSEETVSGNSCRRGEVQVSDGNGGFTCVALNTQNICNGDDLNGRTCSCSGLVTARNNGTNTEYNCAFGNSTVCDVYSAGSCPAQQGFPVCTPSGWQCSSAGFAIGDQASGFNDQTR